MLLFWGVSGITLTAVLLCLLMLSERNPKPSIWKSDFLVGTILVPLVAGMGLLGAMFVIQYIIDYDASAGISWNEVYLSAGVAAAGGALLKSLRIRQRLARYRSLSQAGGAAVHPLQPPGGAPEPPVVNRRAA